jgi:alpha-tubulin suppressor-like RCC1 family protein
MVEAFKGQRIVSADCGSAVTAAVDRRGRLYTWGSGLHGVLGHGDSQTYTKPTMVQDLKSEVVQQVAIGSYHMLAATGKYCIEILLPLLILFPPSRTSFIFLGMERLGPAWTQQ